MMKRALNFLFTTYVSACLPCNDEFSTQLSGEEIPNIKEMFDRFVEDGKSLVDPMEEGRLEIFSRNVIDTIAHNAAGKSFKRGISRHSAMTFQEVKDYYNMDKVNEKAKQNCSATKRAEGEVYTPLGDTPDSWNW